MKRNKLVIGIVSMIAVLLLSACANETEENTGTETESNTEEEMDMESESDSHEGMDHSEMNMSSSGEVPEGLAEAENPTYEVGSQAITETDHMEGMKGAEATIAGAFDTTVYTVSYTPTTGGEEVTDHKWVIHEELENPGEAPLEEGTEITMNADHMKGMDGAVAKIDSAEETTVYMVDFVPTTGGEEVTNHKWVTESELSPVE
ncbi:YdhK family protein [Oceanobacillus profundus]|uniref:YdhK family protein n=1 Tax=Oceanobacillus profundus TaxID=372463 RepID=UPI0026E3D3A7|nr:YdhK family protein [Oceanobacillus profundus]MDO6449426.1 YdhK family protein [Oceanobacillus profundus]